MRRLKRIDLVAPPMSGHLHPLLGIGRRLAHEAHVRVISTHAAQPAIAAAGLEGLALLAGADATIEAIVNPPRTVGSHPLRLHAQFTANLGILDRFRVELRALWSSAPPDLVIADFVVPVAGSTAQALAIPWWTSLPSPAAMETPDGTPGYLGGWRPGGPVAGLRDRMGRAVIRQFKRTVHRVHRTALTELGFPAVYTSEGVEAIYSPACVLALTIPELEFPRTFPSSVRFVGPVLYTPTVGDASPPFVDGRRHVLVTMGTHGSWRKNDLADAVRAIASHLPQVEFHFSDGHQHRDNEAHHNNFHRLSFVSYARHLHRYDLVVHHGGAGILAHTLAAGLPSLVFPLDFDQFDNAARLEWAGVARRVHRLQDLPRLVSHALADADLKRRCRVLQPLVAPGLAEDRIAALVQAI